jgi:hypothetical protein
MLDVGCGDREITKRDPFNFFQDTGMVFLRE